MPSVDAVTMITLSRRRPSMFTSRLLTQYNWTQTQLSRDLTDERHGISDFDGEPGRATAAVRPLLPFPLA